MVVFEKVILDIGVVMLRIRSGWALVLSKCVPTM